jgi:Alkylmercury lyase
MLRTNVLIRSVDPVTGGLIAVTVDDSDSSWRPAAAVEFVGRTASECTGSSAESCCGYINFFTSPSAAGTWASAHPEITGGILNQARALEVGEQIFGQLLQ